MTDQAKTTQNYDQAQALYAQHFSKVKEAAAALSKVHQSEEFQAHASKVGMRMDRVDWQNLIGSLTGEICKDWPIVKKLIGYAQQIASMLFFVPAVAAILGVIAPFVDMIDKQLIPGICAVGGAT